MIFIPAIDIIEGRCVRLTEGDYERRSDYHIEPHQAAARFEAEGASWIHLVDLDGAKAGKITNWEALRKVREAVSCHIEVGGGVRTLADAKALIELGVDRVIFGTRVISDPASAAPLFAELGERAAAGLDLKDGKPATHAWTEVASHDGLELALALEAKGCRRFIVTDIATDGALTGPNMALMRRFVEGLDSPVIASGGVSSLADLHPLASTGVEGVIVGKALYEGRITVTEALGYLGPTSQTSS